MKDGEKLFQKAHDFIRPATKIPVIGNIVETGFAVVKTPWNTIKNVTNPSIDNLKSSYQDYKRIISP